MRESAFRSRFRDDVLRRHPAAVVHVNEARYGAGFPDLTVCVAGQAWFVELKVLRTREFKGTWQAGFTELQLRTLARLANAGMNAVGAILRMDRSVLYLTFRPTKDSYSCLVLENGILPLPAPDFLRRPNLIP